MKRRHVLFSLLALCCLLLTPGGVQAAGKADQGILLVAFGTSEPKAYKSYEAIEAAYNATGRPVIWAFTSEIIRKKVAKTGKVMFSIDEALDEFNRRGVRNLTVQSLHIAPGEEFSYLERAVLTNLLTKPGRFDHVKMARPLMESQKDLDDVLSAVLKDAAATRKPGQALVLMAHGQGEGRCDLVWAAVRSELARRDPLAFLATVEGDYDIDGVLAGLKQKKVAAAVVQPFMVVAGDHARNDMSGPEKDSWTSRMEAEGIKASANLKGLGEIGGVRAVFLRHTDQASEDLAAPKKR